MSCANAHILTCGTEEAVLTCYDTASKYVRQSVATDGVAVVLLASHLNVLL